MSVNSVKRLWGRKLRHCPRFHKSVSKNSDHVNLGLTVSSLLCAVVLGGEKRWLRNRKKNWLTSRTEKLLTDVSFFPSLRYLLNLVSLLFSAVSVELCLYNNSQETFTYFLFIPSRSFTLTLLGYRADCKDTRYLELNEIILSSWNKVCQKKKERGNHRAFLWFYVNYEHTILCISFTCLRPCCGLAQP